MLKQRNKLIDKPFMVVGILIIGVIVCIGLFYIGSFVFAMTVFVSDILFSQKHTYTDVENYTSYIGKDAVEEYSSKWGMDESIFPGKLEMNLNNYLPKEYQLNDMDVTKKMK